MWRRSPPPGLRLRPPRMGKSSESKTKYNGKAEGTLFIGLRREAQVRLYHFPPFRETLLQVFGILQGGSDHHVLAILPIHRSGHLVIVGELHGIEHAQDLLEV